MGKRFNYYWIRPAYIRSFMVYKKFEEINGISFRTISVGYHDWIEGCGAGFDADRPERMKRDI